MDVVLRFRGTNQATVRDIVDIRKFITKRIVGMEHRISKRLGDTFSDIACGHDGGMTTVSNQVDTSSPAVSIHAAHLASVKEGVRAAAATQRAVDAKVARDEAGKMFVQLAEDFVNRLRSEHHSYKVALIHEISSLRADVSRVCADVPSKWRSLKVPAATDGSLASSGDISPAIDSSAGRSRCCITNDWRVDSVRVDNTGQSPTRLAGDAGQSSKRLASLGNGSSPQLMPDGRARV